MNPENQDNQTNRDEPKPSGMRKLVDMLVWVVLPIVGALGLAVKYWPQ